MTAAQESFHIQQFKLGDTNSFQILYQHYNKIMLRYGKSLFPYHEDDIKDAFHDIFISLWNAGERLKVDNTLDFYLKRSIKNYMIRVKQKGVKFDTIPDENNSGCFELSDKSNLLSSMIESELSAHNNKLYLQKLSLLTKRQRFLFTERFIHEKSVEEIMKEHNIARQTVYNMICKIVTKLKTNNNAVFN